MGILCLRFFHYELSIGHIAPFGGGVIFAFRAWSIATPLTAFLDVERPENCKKKWPYNLWAMQWLHKSFDSLMDMGVGA